MIPVNLFFPERIGSYFIKSRIFTAFALNRRTISVTVLRATGRQRIIEQSFEQPIAQDEATPFNERVTAALHRAFEKVPAKSIIISVLPSTSVLFKVITVPLMSYEKIRLIVPFEIEASLPFPLAEAALDTLVTVTNSAEKTASVLVAATQRSLLEEHKLLFQSLGKKVDFITTSVVALYNLIAQTPSFQKPGQPLFTVDIEHTGITVMLSLNNEVRAVRVLPRSTAELQDGRLTDTTLTAVAHTIQSFSKYYEGMTTLPLIMICGTGSGEQSITQSLEEKTGISCEQISIQRLLQNGALRPAPNVTPKQFITLAATLPDHAASRLNLDKEAEEQEYERTIISQTIVGICLFVALLGIIFATRIIVVRKLRREIAASEQEAIDVLRSRLRIHIPKGAALDSANKTAHAFIVSKEKIWSSLSNDNKFIIIKVLQELSTILNRRELGLELQQLDISTEDDTINMQGSVKDFDALHKLEDGLKQSALFKNIPHLQETTFVAKMNLIRTGASS